MLYLSLSLGLKNVEDPCNLMTDGQRVSSDGGGEEESWCSTCTAKSQMIPRRWAELHTADVCFGLDAGHRVVQVGRPQLHWKNKASDQACDHHKPNII